MSVVKLIGFKPQTASKTHFTIPVAIENAKLKLSLAISTGAPKVHQLKIYQNSQRKQYIC